MARLRTFSASSPMSMPATMARAKAVRAKTKATTLLGVLINGPPVAQTPDDESGPSVIRYIGSRYESLHEAKVFPRGVR